MRALIVALALFVSIPSLAGWSGFAGEKTPFDELIENLPPMPADQRAAFDKAARSMYRSDCRCLTYLFEGKIKRADLPLSDGLRWLLIDGIKRGVVIPFGPGGRGS